MITSQAVPNRRTDLVLRPAAQIAPGAGAVLLDTLPIGPNQVFVEVRVTASADANGATPQLIHRNAANAADLEVTTIPLETNFLAAFPTLAPPEGASGLLSYTRARVALATGERLLVRNLVAAAAGESWQAQMDVWVL